MEDPGGTGRGGFGTIQKPIDNLLDKNKEQNIVSLAITVNIHIPE